MKFKYLLPGLYQRFFPKTLWDASILETKATCHQCIQAPHKYDSHLKCCTFWPYIPNYIVGEILLNKEDKYQSVQKLIRKHIENQNWNLPIGLVAPARYQVGFKKNKDQIFGRNSEFLCPYFSKQNDNCGLWLYRGSVCTSFFCESSYGKRGQEFWQAFENYFSYLEMGISQEVLVYKDFSPRDVSDQIEYLMIESNRNLTKLRYERLWKHFLGQEIEFYIQSAQFVRQMPNSQINEILGETGQQIKNQMLQKMIR